jgi:hypothetical protein
MKRARYQEGCLTRSKRRSGAVWEYHSRQRQPDGSKEMRYIVVGPLPQLKPGQPHFTTSRSFELTEFSS